MHFERADAVFSALGDPTRRQMVSLLSRRPRSVSDLADELSISRTAIGQHLAVLEQSGLAASKKAGRVRTCHLRAEGLMTIRDWVDFHRDQFDSALDRLGEVLDDKS